MKKAQKNKSQAGFSLIELAVVLIIMGLLIGGVLKGKDLIESARLKRVISQLNEYRMATSAFLDKFEALPGDFNKASTLIKPGLRNGNGNGIIEGAGLSSSSEALLFWSHLAAAGLIGSPGRDADQNVGEFGKGAPESSMGGGFTVENNPQGLGGLWFILGTKQGDHGMEGLLTPAQAMSIDKKLDNGHPTSGKVRAMEGLIPVSPKEEHITLRIMIQLAYFSFSSKPEREAGFSLLELAIVLVILGIIGGLSLPLLTAQMNRAAYVKTRSHQDYVLSAIASFVEKNKRFPCPAEPLAIGDSYGVMQVQCRGQKAQGIVPFKTLGISEVYARDGFKRLMTYVVDQDLAKKDTNLKIESGGSITVKGETGEFVLATPQKEDKNPNYIALVLISHGESGGGAFMGNGQATRFPCDPSSPQKRQNFNGGFTFIESSQTNDILRWESRDQFLKHYVNLK